MKRSNILVFLLLLTALGCEQVTENDYTTTGGNWQIDKN